jgi:hypothetical protein
LFAALLFLFPHVMAVSVEERKLGTVSGKPVASKISSTKEGYRAADNADAWNRTVDFLAKTLKN